MKAELGTAIVERIKNVLAARDREEAAIAAKIKEVEAQGYRVVNFGQVSTGYEPFKMECTDYRTGEIVWVGTGDDCLERAPSDNWYNIDFLTDEVGEIAAVKVKSMPEWLATAIEGMVFENEDEFRELVATAEQALNHIETGE